MRKHARSNKWLTAVLVFGLTTPGAVLSLPNRIMAAETNPISERESTLLELFTLIRDYHWEQVDEDILLRGAVQGMLDALNDPYTTYFTSDEYQAFVNSINQTYAGIGVRLGVDEKGYYADEVFAGAPAETSGMKKGDRILAVDGQDTIGQTLDTVGGWLRGTEGTTVNLKLERAGQDPFSLTITRKGITLPSLTSKLLDVETGYIRILSFSATVGDEFDLALADLQRKGVKSLVLDLRGNGGGFLPAAVQIADRFLAGGLIASIKYRGGEDRITADVESVQLPVNILIDGGSASASEFLAGSLRANKRALLVGERSFGKGVIQQVVPLQDNSYLKLTTEQFYFADDTSPHHVGLTPDVTIRSEDLTLPVAFQMLHPGRGKTVTFDLANKKTFVNSIELHEQKTFVKENLTYVPLRFTMEALGSEVIWNPAEWSIAFQYEGRSVKIMMGTGDMTIDGQPVVLSHPLVVEEGTSYLSLEAVKAALHPDVVSNQADRIEISDK
jgi:carboxyl-terminal processing protease